MRDGGERLSRVLEIGRALGSTLDLDELLSLVVHHASELLEADRCTVFIHDHVKAELWSRVGQGLSRSVIRLPVSRGLVGAAVTERRPIVVADAYRDPRFDPEFDQGTGYRTGSVLAVPMISRDGRTAGVLQALNKRGGSFGAEDEEVALALAGQAAAALENGRLYQAMLEKNAELSAAQARLQKALRELDALYEVEQKASSGTEPDALLEVALTKAVALTDAEAGSILLTREQGDGTLFFHSALGEKGDEVRRLTLPPGRGLAGAAALSGKALIANDPATEPSYDPSVAERVGFPVRNILAVPVAWEGESYGALELLNKKGRGFSDDELRLATLIAGQSARAIHRSRRSREEERRGRLQLVGQMLSGLLHDLRTPMTIISGYAQLMEGEADRDQRRRGKEMILKQFDLINSMTGEVLAFVRGERELLVRKVHLNFFLDDVEAFVRKDLEGSGIELSLSRGYEGTVRFDENKVKRAIFNLVRNAVQAMPEGGRLTLASKLEDGAWVLRCGDTGKGIPPEIAAHVFEEFVTHGKTGGTGLGLALVKRIVEEHGGTLGFETEVGKGTTFWIRLPQGPGAE
ncbi:MAG TPA: GAF domain-containing protein [Myxococcales bacterium]|nr:GAF domain-containing protein [Myxococcales bacterium]